ncbi:MAG: hypothetical protein C0393_08190, partial [Anaerolinea sp.]|nr:hypothetical protein [Anaerolinea sp.]
MFQSPPFTQLADRISQIMAVVYQGIALVALIAIPFQAANWLKTPFIGAFVGPTMIFNGIRTAGDAEAGTPYSRGIQPGDQLLQINGKDIHTASDMQQALASRKPGEAVSFIIRTPTGEVQTDKLKLQVFFPSDLIKYVYIPYLVGWMYLVISLWIFGLRRKESAGRALALFAASAAIASAGMFDLYTTHRLTYLWIFAVAFAGGALLELGMTYPQEVRRVARWPFLQRIGYLIAIMLAGLVTVNLNAQHLLGNFNNPSAFFDNWRYISFFSGASFLFFVAMLVYRRFTSRSPLVRQEVNTILAGIMIAFGPLAGWLLLNVFRPMDFSPLLLLFTVLFPAVTGYTLLGQTPLWTGFLLRRGILYALLSILVAAGYVLLVSGLSLIFGEFIAANNPLLIGLTVLALAVILTPLRSRLQKGIDALFLRGQGAHQEHIQDFTQELTRATELSGILRTLRDHIMNALTPGQLHIYIYDPLNDRYLAASGEDDRPTSDIHFGPNNPFVETLRNAHKALFIDEANLPATLQSEKVRLALLGAQLFIPLSGNERLIGWLALGAPRSVDRVGAVRSTLRQAQGSAYSAQNYTGQDITFLNLLGDQ